MSTPDLTMRMWASADISTAEAEMVEFPPNYHLMRCGECGEPTWVQLHYDRCWDCTGRNPIGGFAVAELEWAAYTAAITISRFVSIKAARRHVDLDHPLSSPESITQ